MTAAANRAPEYLPMANPPASLTPVPIWRLLGQRLIQASGLAGAIALFMTLALDIQFAPTLVYSACITFFCWLFIEGGSQLAFRWQHRRDVPNATRQPIGLPSAGWLSAVLLVGTLGGFALGTMIAAALLAQTSLLDAAMDLRSMAASFIMAIITGVGVTYYFHSRERLAASAAQAEQAERLAAEQRLKMLASQLEPHMLFNTLANLRALIGIDPPRAQAMLDRLIQFLRGSLDASRASTHPLADEFAHLGHYLELMQIRMGARLQARSSLPDELAAHPVPTMLLQPLVENAIKHGLEPHVQGGRIEISAEREGTQLVLKVRDTGTGLRPTAAACGSGFGLEQVRERLATLYGKSASLDLAPAPGPEGGTLATLRLPL